PIHQPRRRVLAGSPGEFATPHDRLHEAVATTEDLDLAGGSLREFGEVDSGAELQGGTPGGGEDRLEDLRSRQTLGVAPQPAALAAGGDAAVGIDVHQRAADIAPRDVADFDPGLPR